MEITQYFSKNDNNKRNLSDQSYNGEEPKKQKDDSANELFLSDEAFSYRRKG